MTKTTQTKLYSKISYIKKRIKHANNEFNNTEIDTSILKRKLKHYNKQIINYERDYVLLPNLHIEIVKMKKILDKEIKECNEFLAKKIYIDWETGEVTIK